MAMNPVLVEKIEVDVEEEDAVVQSSFKSLPDSKYFYETLYKSKEHSDVSLVIFGKTWELHKLVLCQTPYFASMLSGFWIEGKENVINIEIPDDNITEESLEDIFASLYFKAIDLGPRKVISVLATATLFHLQELIDRCIVVMEGTIKKRTVIPYLKAAEVYDVALVEASAKRWLELNILTSYSSDYSFLKLISPELLTILVSSSSLLTYHSERYIYRMLRNWLFAHVRNSDDHDISVDDFYQNRTWTTAFLSTEEGKEFSSPFKSLKIKHMSLGDVEQLKIDHLMPEEWIFTAAYNDILLPMLKVDSNTDMGPKEVDPSDFERDCFRGAWQVTAEHYAPVSFSVNFFCIFESEITIKELSQVCIKRIHAPNQNSITTDHEEHNVMLKVSLIALNEEGHVRFQQDSELLSLSLKRNEEKNVMTIKDGLLSPFYVAIKLQVTTPLKAN